MYVEQGFADILVEAMPGIFYLYDEAGRFRRWNRNFERVTGYAAHEIREMQPADFFVPEHRGLLQERIREVFASGTATVEASLRAKDGSARPHFFTGARTLIDGAPHLVGVGVDISAQHAASAALAKTEERYRTTLDSIFEACQLLDFDWRYLYLNPAAAQQNRRPNSELLGQRMMDAWPGIEGTAVFALLNRCMKERAPMREEIAFAFADGSSGWFDVRVQPVPEGIFVLSLDVTERRRAQIAMLAFADQLERKVAERTLELEAARERAEAADKLKSAFLATMSHELRTPLNSILGFTGIVLKEMAGPLTQEQTKQLGMVQGSARHLLDLINDVLDISKIEAGQLEVHLAPFDLDSSVERVAGSVLPFVQRKGLTLTVELAPLAGPMISDRRRVEQILLNLLNNAVKFTETGSVILRVDLHDELLQLRVEDTGIGMKPADLESLFKPFRQIDSGLQRKHEGTGLGLAICRRLCSLLGGSIQVSSEWGRGSVFTVNLPWRS